MGSVRTASSQAGACWGASRGWRAARLSLAVPLVVAVITAAPSRGAAQSPDRVKLLDRKEVSGELLVTSPNDVELQDARGEMVRIPVDRIREVLLGGEPQSLRNARGMLLRQDAPAALEELGKVAKVELDGASDLVLAEMEFVQAAALGRVAATGGSDVAKGEQALREFLKAHPESFHLYDVQEALAALLARAGRYDEAAAALAPLAKGPASVRVRAAVGKARLFYEQRKYAEAMSEFEAAERAQTDEGDLASRRQKAEATLGRARCLARLDKAAEAIAIVTAGLESLGSQEGELLALSYATLGDACRAAGGKDQDAIIAFLRVDLVHNSVADAHAEALFNLVQLWENVKVPERSRQVRQALETTYPDSRWTRLLADGQAAREP